MKPRFLFPFLASSLCTTFLSATAGAVTLNWTGGSAGTLANMATASNWQESASPSTGPDAPYDLVIANRNDASPPVDPLPAIPTLLTGADYTIRSITADNTAGRYGTSGLRIGPATSTTSTTARILSFNTPGINIITAANNASLTFWRYTSTASMTLNLNYSGASTITADATSRVVFDAAPMTGTGGIIKAGDGSVSTGNSHTYSGGTTLNAGTWIGNSSSLRDLTTLVSGPFGIGPLNLHGGTVRSSGADPDPLITTDNRVYHNSVILSGNTTFGGAIPVDGVPILTGSQTFTDTTLATTSLAASVTVDIQSDTFFSQPISATNPANTLTKSGPELLVLGRDNSFDGGIIVTQGSLGFGTNLSLGNGPVTLQTGSRLGSNVGALSPSNPIEITGNTGFGLGTFTTVLSGPVDLNGATRSITLVNSTTLNGEISNGGITVVSSSATRSLTLGNNNNYSGPTTVSGGRLIVNGSITSAVTGATTTTIGGEGSITGGVTTDGHITPGSLTANTPGTLTVNGAVTVNTGGDATFEILDTGSYDNLVTTSLSLDGPLNVSLLNSFEPAAGDSFDLVDGTITLGPNFSFNLPALPGGKTWNTSAFATTGVISVTSGVVLTPFQTWAASYSLSGDNALSTGNPDKDGLTNLQEFAFGTNPTTLDGAILKVEKSGTNALFTYIERNADVTYTVKSGSTLTGWTTATGITYLGGVDQTGVLSGYTRKQFTSPLASKEFFRIEAVANP